MTESEYSWDEPEVVLDMGFYVFRRHGTYYPLHRAVDFPGFEGIIWRDEPTGLEGCAWVPLGLGVADVFRGVGERLTTYPQHWIRPCHPVRVKFRRSE